jgi:uncharacterized membrane protein (DUF373 family)
MNRISETDRGASLLHAKPPQRSTKSERRAFEATERFSVALGIRAPSTGYISAWLLRPSLAIRVKHGREAWMSIKKEMIKAKEDLRLLSIYQRFEHIVVMILTALIAVIVVAAVWNLSLKILFGLVLSGGLDASDHTAFQAEFGMIFTVIIALEFKKSLLVVAERRDTVVQIRSVVMIALLAICRKVIIPDLAETDALHILALGPVILALGQRLRDAPHVEVGPSSHQPDAFY